MVRAALADDYEVISELGRGGMAVVYKARERSLDRSVALKVLPFSLAHDDGLVERFQREARTASQLEHPHIIPVYRVGRSGQVIYFAMKLLRGLSLSDRLLEHGRLSPAETRRMLVETAGALGCAHKRGVVHRDVKPDNILLDEDGRCVVTDFGIARSASDSTLTAAGTSLGTPRYMSPEQARGRGVDGRSDLYSLGIVAYQCLAGRVPFDGSDMMAILLSHVSTPAPRPRNLDEQGSSLYAIVERLLEKDPRRRFQSAEELVAALNAPEMRTGTTPAASVTTTLDAAADSLVEGGTRLLEQAVAAARVHTTRARTRVAALPRRTQLLLGGAALLMAAVPPTAHFATLHRSRCPASSEPQFSVLLDDGEPVGHGDDVEVYYDVCGLEKGTKVTERVTLVRRRSGFQRLLRGNASPLTEKFTETVSGGAERRHRTLEPGKRAVGTYVLSVIVTDAKGRRREEATTLRIGNDTKE